MDGQVPKLNYICMLTTWFPTVTIICNNLIKTGSVFNVLIIPAFSDLNYDGILVVLIIMIILHKETAALLIIELAKQITIFAGNLTSYETDYFHGLASLKVPP